jgi:hypothetical protein
MRIKPWTIEHTLYLLAFLLGLGVRLWNLGATPLSDFEAVPALQALQLVRGEHPVLGPQPLYLMWTALSFLLTGASNGMARLLPALAGTALPLFPLFFRQLRGFNRTAGLILAFGLALDPGLVATSRVAGGPMLALVFCLFTLGFAYLKQAPLAGVFGGLALLSGVPVVPGILGLFMAWVTIRWLSRSKTLAPPQAEDTPATPTRSVGELLRNGLLAAGGTLLLIGTGFLLVPQGMAALADTLSSYLKGWANPSDIIMMGRIPAALFFYQPLALIFGIIGAVRGWVQEDALSQRLSLWALIAFVLALAYPARQASDLVWTLIPLWALAALELSRYLSKEEEPAARMAAGGHTIGVGVLLVIGWLGLTANRWLIVVGMLGVLIALTILVATGWGMRAAWRGLVWGLSLGLGLGMLASMWGTAHLRLNGAEELWSTPPATGQADLLLSTLGDLSEWETGHRNMAEVVVVSDSAALRWALHDFSQARFVSQIPSGETPPILITHLYQAAPALSVIYRGQDFIWRIDPGWQGVIPSEWARWIAFRQAPLVQEQIIVWARTDVFPGGVLESMPVETTTDQETAP